MSRFYSGFGGDTSEKGAVIAFSGRSLYNPGYSESLESPPAVHGMFGCGGPADVVLPPTSATPIPVTPRHAIGPGGSSTDVRSPTSTRTEVRSPTSTRTEVRSPTSTSTEAYTQGNFTATVHIHAAPLPPPIANAQQRYNQPQETEAMTYSNYYGYGFGAPSAIAPSELSNPMPPSPDAMPPIVPIAAPLPMAAVPPIAAITPVVPSLMPPAESAPQAPLTPTLQPSQTPTIPGVSHGMNDGMRCGVLFIPVGFMPFDLG